MRSKTRYVIDLIVLALAIGVLYISLPYAPRYQQPAATKIECSIAQPQPPQVDMSGAKEIPPPH